MRSPESPIPTRPPGDPGYPTFLSPHASPIAVSGEHVFVANTPADTVDVIDVATRVVVARVPVGIDPVSVAVRPDGKEVWVANHVSDSVSVIDSDVTRPTYLQVIATVQDVDPATRATRLDEPVGIAFASDDKAYVALSSENRIAVIDVATRAVARSLAINAQDPRALVVRGNRLHVIPFESNNQTQLSGCVGSLDGELCTFDALLHVVTNNNVLSLGYSADIVKHPDVPDRDLYIFDTRTDELVEVVDTLGTLLYGLTVDSAGRVFVAQTDARNDANGRAGTLGDGLEELENRAFLNQITRVDCRGGSCSAPEFIDLEPVPPLHPAPGMALATPFAIEISDDDATLVVSAAGSDKLFTVDAASGAVLGRVEVDAVPRGIALESDGDGQASLAWVLNAVANTVSLVDVADPGSPMVVESIVLDDPTHPAVKRGRMAFNDADASTTGTFSCESCHPDGHTDQLLWVLDTPACDVNGCDQIPPRSTMPIRGLRDTAPYHWDGIPGDPFGGNNTANINGDEPPNCSLDDPASCTRVLVDGGLATTMCKLDECPVNDEGEAGALSAAQRDDMATFLLSALYPPAQRRSYDNVLSQAAEQGFDIFHVTGVTGGRPDVPNLCGNCHRMPFWVSTNTPGTGMDAPTWRGAYDRWLILPQGRANVIDLVSDFKRDNGFPEQSMWGAGDEVWQMVLEGSTGFSGSFGRSVTLDERSAGDGLTGDLLDALERSAREGGVVLHGDGVFIDGGVATPVALEFDGRFAAGDAESAGRPYVERGEGAGAFSRGELEALAAEGRFVGTFTARAGAKVDVDHPQPGIWTGGPMQEQRRRVVFPAVSMDETAMVLYGRHVQEGAHVIVDGRRVPGQVYCETGELPRCDREIIVVELEALPASNGTHFLQIQNPDGLFSNDFIFYTDDGGGCRVTSAGADGSIFWLVMALAVASLRRRQTVVAGTSSAAPR